MGFIQISLNIVLYFQLTHLSKLLNECIGISEGLPESEGQRHLARALFKLSKLYESRGNVKESAECLDRAVSIKAEIASRENSVLDSGDLAADFERLVPWMLW